MPKLQPLLGASRRVVDLFHSSFLHSQRQPLCKQLRVSAAERLKRVPTTAPLSFEPTATPRSMGRSQQRLHSAVDSGSGMQVHFLDCHPALSGNYRLFADVCNELKPDIVVSVLSQQWFDAFDLENSPQSEVNWTDAFELHRALATDFSAKPTAFEQLQEYTDFRSMQTAAKQKMLDAICCGGFHSLSQLHAHSHSAAKYPASDYWFVFNDWRQFDESTQEPTVEFFEQCQDWDLNNELVTRELSAEEIGCAKRRVLDVFQDIGNTLLRNFFDETLHLQSLFLDHITCLSLISDDLMCTALHSILPRVADDATVLCNNAMGSNSDNLRSRFIESQQIMETSGKLWPFQIEVGSDDTLHYELNHDCDKQQYAHELCRRCVDLRRDYDIPKIVDMLETEKKTGCLQQVDDSEFIVFVEIVQALNVAH